MQVFADFEPPFSRLIRLTLKHNKNEVVMAAADILGGYLQKNFDNISGPVAPIISRVRNMYLMEILLKLQQDSAQLKSQKKVIHNQIDLLKSDKRFRSIVVVADVDPF